MTQDQFLNELLQQLIKHGQPIHQISFCRQSGHIQSYNNTNVQSCRELYRISTLDDISLVNFKAVSMCIVLRDSSSLFCRRNVQVGLFEKNSIRWFRDVEVIDHGTAFYIPEHIV